MLTVISQSASCREQQNGLSASFDINCSCSCLILPAHDWLCGWSFGKSLWRVAATGRKGLSGKIAAGWSVALGDRLKEVLLWKPRYVDPITFAAPGRTHANGSAYHSYHLLRGPVERYRARHVASSQIYPQLSFQAKICGILHVYLRTPARVEANIQSLVPS